MRLRLAAAAALAAAPLALAAIPAQGKPYPAIVPQEGERYNVLTLFQGPCTPANTLPAPSRGDQQATSTWVETSFHGTDPEARPWGVLAPRPKTVEDGAYPQPENPRGACRANHRGRAMLRRDAVQAIHTELGPQTMTSYRITATSELCGAGTSGADISPQANWCFIDEGTSGEELIGSVTFEIYWNCLYEVLRADPGGKVSHRSGAKKGVEPLRQGGVIYGGDAFIVPFGGTAVLRSGGVEMHLTGGFYETKKLNECELKALGDPKRLLEAQPAPVPPKIKDGKISATIDDVKSFVMETPGAVIRGLTGADRRAMPDERPDAFTVAYDRKTRTTRVCAKHGRVLADPRARGERTVRVAAGRCAVLRRD